MNKEEREFDEMMKQKLRKEFEIDEERKERLWNRLESELEFMPTKKKFHWKPAVAFLAAAILLTIGLTTEQGSNMLNHIVGNVAPQKEAQNMNGSSGDQEGTNGAVEDNSMDEENENVDIENPINEETNNTDIKRQFVNEKEIEIELEGMKEPITVTRHQSPNSDYLIYIDLDRYKMLTENGEVTITTR